MSKTVDFFVAGEPAPKGSRTFYKNGGSRESSKKVEPWVKAVRNEAAQHFGDAELIREMAPTLTGPVLVEIRFLLRRPKSHYGTGKNAGQVRAGAPSVPTVYPDLDKLTRAVLDGLRAGGAYKDDAQVTDIVVRKRYAHTTMGAGAEIVVIDLSDGSI